MLILLMYVLVHTCDVYMYLPKVIFLSCARRLVRGAVFRLDVISHLNVRDIHYAARPLY